MSYFYPSKASEVVFCRGNEQVPNCVGNHGSYSEPKIQMMGKLQDVERLNSSAGVFRSSDAVLNESVSLVGLSPKSCDSNGKCNTKHISTSTASTTESLGWTSQWKDLLSPGLSQMRRRQQHNAMCDALASCSTSHSFNRSMHSGIDTDARREYSDSSEIAHSEKNRSEKLGDSGRLQTYNPAADRQAHLHSKQVSLGAPSCQSPGISYDYPKGLLSR